MITERSVQRRSPGVAEPAPREEARRDRMAVLRGYLALTKPAIVELLLGLADLALRLLDRLPGLRLGRGLSRLSGLLALRRLALSHRGLALLAL